MNEDPIVADERRIRERRARRFDYDIHKIFAGPIARKASEDPSHPTVEDAEEWASAVAAEDTLALKEEPPRDL